MFYNVVQMIGNIWLLQGYLKHGWLTEYNWSEYELIELRRRIIQCPEMNKEK